MLKPYKFIVQAVLQRLDDDDGNVLGEAQTEPVVLFGCDQLAAWATEFPAKLAEADVAQTAGT